MTTLYEYSRKPNYKKWICPIDGKVINSRGAPAYLRNKYNIPWDQKYLEKPGLLCDGIEDAYKSELFYRIRALFFNVEIENTELNRKTLKALYSLVFKLRFAIYCKKNESVSKAIYSIQSITGPVK